MLELLDKVVKFSTRLSPVVVGGVPRRVRETQLRYDMLRGFNAYLRYCQAQMQRSIPAVETDLHRQHIEILRFLSEEKAKAYLAEAYALATGFTSRRNKGNRLYFEINDEDFFVRLFEDVFSPEVDARIVRYFGSEYVPYWYVFQESRPGTTPSNSFMWHCDRGPSRWLKILLYFTPTRETGGSTIVLDKEESDLVARADYTFGKTSRRTAELADLERLTGRKLHAIMPEMEVGEGILFEPSRLLHRGLIPDKAPRVVLQILILPSPVPWRTALERLRTAHLPERETLHFPDHAKKLQRILTN